MRRTAVIAMIVSLLSGCRVVDPIVVGNEFNVQAPGATEIRVQLKGGETVPRIRQKDVVYDYMLDLSKDPSRRSAAFDAMLELENLFALNGFPDAHVTHRVEDGGKSVTFEITERERVILGRCTIVGGHLTEEELLVLLPTRKTEVFGLGDNLYVAEDIDTLRRGILNRYSALGYLDVEVEIEPRKPMPERPGAVEVRLRVDPKSIYTIKSVTAGASIEAKLTEFRRLERKEPESESDHLERPKQGEPFVSLDLQNYLMAITRKLRHWGHPEPNIRATIQRDSEGHTVEVRIDGETGESVTVSEIEIRGHTYVSENTIRERISLQTGHRFDGEREEKSLLRLYRSGRFQRIEVEYEPLGEKSIRVVFILSETTRYLIEPMIGAGSYERIRGGIEFEMLSVLGTDYDLRTEAVISDRGHRVVASIADSEFLPDIFGLDTTLSIAADDYRREEPSYVDGASGLTPSLSQIYNERWSSRLAYTIREHGDATSRVIDPGAQIGNYREGSLTLEVSYDSRDNPVIPKKGTRTALQHTWADDSLGGDVSFHRTRFFASQIVPLQKNLRLVFRTEATVLVPDSDLDTIPIQERVFNGGEITVRSYREDQLAPANLRDVNNRVIGGSYRTVLNSELRWSPPYQPFRAIELEFALFGDAGNLGRSNHEFGFSDLRYGVGSGIRFLLPIGPVRFDYTHNPNREPGERDWTFHFSIGHAF